MFGSIVPPYSSYQHEPATFEKSNTGSGFKVNHRPQKKIMSIRRKKNRFISICKSFAAVSVSRVLNFVPECGISDVGLRCMVSVARVTLSLAIRTDREYTFVFFFRSFVIIIISACDVSVCVSKREIYCRMMERVVTMIVYLCNASARRCTHPLRFFIARCEYFVIVMSV